MLERFEQAGFLFVADADAGILDRDSQPECTAFWSGFFEAHADTAVLGELHRIAHQVDHDLAQAYRISVQDRRHVLVPGGFQGDALIQCRGSDSRLRRGQQFVDIEVAPLELDLACFQLRKVEEFVDDLEQVVGRTADDPRVVTLLVVELGLFEQARETDHPGHRGADLVADGGEKLAFRLVGCLGPLFGRLQFLGTFDDLCLEILSVVVQLMIVGMNPLQHVVETVGQLPEFVFADALGTVCEATGGRDAFHRIQQALDRDGHDLLQSAGQQQCQQHGDDEYGNGQNCLHGEDVA